LFHITANKEDQYIDVAKRMYNMYICVLFKNIQSLECPAQISLIKMFLADSNFSK